MRRLTRFIAAGVLLSITIAYLVGCAVIGVFASPLWFGPLILGGLAVVAAARFWHSSPEPIPTPVDEWLVWDEELEADLSDVERQMLRYGYVAVDPVDLHQAQIARVLNDPTRPELPLILPSQRTYTRHRRGQR